MKTITGIAITIGAVVTVLLSMACNKLDVVGNNAKVSFAAVLSALDGEITVDDSSGGWRLDAPDGGAAFIWLPDYSKSRSYDAALIFDAAPFINAGLDVQKLRGDFTVISTSIGGTITVGVKLGSQAAKYSGAPTPLASFEQIVDVKREVIGYHAALDHYGVTIGDGNLFEFAKDMAKNDKDIVFVLNPQPFIDAGVNPATVEGWAFAKVPVDVNGKPVEVDKFLKPFDL
jgi:hypothetical protein